MLKNVKKGETCENCEKMWKLWKMWKNVEKNTFEDPVGKVELGFFGVQFCCSYPAACPTSAGWKSERSNSNRSQVYCADRRSVYYINSKAMTTRSKNIKSNAEGKGTKPQNCWKTFFHIVFTCLKYIFSQFNNNAVLKHIFSHVFRIFNSNYYSPSVAQLALITIGMGIHATYCNSHICDLACKHNSTNRRWLPIISNPAPTLSRRLSCLFRPQWSHAVTAHNFRGDRIFRGSHWNIRCHSILDALVSCTCVAVNVAWISDFTIPSCHWPIISVPDRRLTSFNPSKLSAFPLAGIKHGREMKQAVFFGKVAALGVSPEETSVSYLDWFNHSFKQQS